jgi:hypothetical protein
VRFSTVFLSKGEDTAFVAPAQANKEQHHFRYTYNTDGKLAGDKGIVKGR